MDLVIDTSGITFQVGRGFEARLDKDGVHRRDKAGRTNLPLYAVQLIAFDEGGAETILVTVATDNPPKVSQGQSVRLERLQDPSTRVVLKHHQIIRPSAPMSFPLSLDRRRCSTKVR